MIVPLSYSNRDPTQFADLLSPGVSSHDLECANVSFGSVGGRKPFNFHDQHRVKTFTQKQKKKMFIALVQSVFSPIKAFLNVEPLV
jgi:hypothetical protein